MPYVKRDQRVFESTEIEKIPLDTPGNLNYIITYLIKKYYKSKKFNYQVINDIVGAVEGAKLEFVRRIVNDYEDIKIQENGDVY